MRTREPVGPGSVGQLLHCLSAGCEPGTAWNEVVTAAAYHGLAPLLFKRLKQNAARAVVPPETWKLLRQAYLVSAGRSIRLHRELGGVLRRLRDSGIKVVALKGAYLAEAVYGDAALRPMCDADLMVPKAEIPRARAVLLDMDGSHQLQEDTEAGAPTQFHLPRIVVHDLIVELHWTIAPPTGPFGIDAAGLWNRARAATIAGVDALALSPEDLLLHLCLHFSYLHGHVWLKPLCDVAETVLRLRDEMDWPQVARLAREWGAGRHAGLTLCLVRDLLDAEVPDDALERLVPGGIAPRVLDTAKESVLTRTDYRQWLPFFEPWGARSLGARARLAWKRVFLPREEMAAMYPGARAARNLWLYYALRLGHVTRSYGSHTLRRGLPLIRSRGRERKVALAEWLSSGGT